MRNAGRIIARCLAIRMPHERNISSSFVRSMDYLPAACVQEIWKEGEFAIMSRDWKQKRSRDD
jgi:hypothetical protein